MEQFVLQFIGGPQQGREFALQNDRTIIVGRADEADLPIPEDIVSRKHATLTAKNGAIFLEDYSANGTFVNDQPVKNALLHSGDQVRVGTSTLKVVVIGGCPTFDKWIIGEKRQSAPISLSRFSSSPPYPQSALATAEAPAPSSAGAHRPKFAPAAPQPPHETVAPTEHLRGSLADIVLCDLLQLLSGSRKSGILILRCAQGVGRIYLDQGQICHASISEIESANPHKVFYRLLRWTEGTFEFEPPDGRTFGRPLNQNTEFLLLEAMQQYDEINNLGTDLPQLHAEIYLASPLPAPLRELSPGDLDFIQLVLHHVTVSSILDHYTGSDFEAYAYLKSLLSRKFLTVGQT